MKKCVALRNVYYASKEHKPGDVFDVQDAHAEILCGIGYAALEVAPAKQPTPPEDTKPHTTLPTVSSEDQGGDQPVSPPRRRRYARRDMMAED